MFIEFQDRSYRDEDDHYRDQDPYRDNFRGIHSHEIPWRSRMPNAANEDGTLVEPMLWQYAQNGNWHEVYTRVCSNPDEAIYAQNGWTPLHLLVAGNGIPAPLNVVRAVYAAFPDALYIKTDHYDRTPLEIAKDWNQPEEVIEFLSDPQIFELKASSKEYDEIEGLELPGSSSSAVNTPMELPGGNEYESMNNNDIIDVNPEQVSEDDAFEQQSQQLESNTEYKQPSCNNDGLDNCWAAASGGTINGDYRPAFEDASGPSMTGTVNRDYQPSFGDNIVSRRAPAVKEVPAVNPHQGAPTLEHSHVVGAYADRPNDVAQVPDYTEASTTQNDVSTARLSSSPIVNNDASIPHDRSVATEVVDPSVNHHVAPEPETEYYDASVGDITNEESAAIDPVITNDHASMNSDATQSIELCSDDDTVRHVPDDLVCVIVDDDALEEEIHNKRIMEEVRLQQYQDEIEQQRKEEAMRERAQNARQSQADWGDWGAKQGHSWIKFTL